MAKKGIPILSGFDLGSKSNLDMRKDVAAPEDLGKMPESSIPEGLIVFIPSEKKYFNFDSTREIDPANPELGKWRETNIMGTAGPHVKDNTLILS